MTDIKEPINTTSDGQWCVKIPKEVLLARTWGGGGGGHSPPPRDYPLKSDSISTESTGV